MKTKLVLFLGFAFVGILLFAKEVGVDQHLLSDFAKMTGERYLKQRVILSAEDLEEKRFDMPKSSLCKAMLSILELHAKHPKLCDNLNKKKEKLESKSYGIVSYARGNHSFLDYIWKYEKGKPNPEYQKYMDNISKEKPQKNKNGAKKHDNAKNLNINENGKIVLTLDKNLKMPKEWRNRPSKYLPLAEDKKQKKMKRASWARIRLLEYALKETNKPHELYAILLMNPYIDPKENDINYESAKTLYDYVVLRYIYNLDIILSEMAKRDEGFNEVYNGKSRYMYTVEKALTLLDKNKLYGTVSLLEALRKHFEANPKGNKIITDAINKKIEEFQAKNAKEIQWSDVFERVNPM